MQEILAIMALGLILFGLYTNKTSIKYQCGICGHQFSIRFIAYIFSLQRSRKKFLKCTRCKSWSWAAGDNLKEKGLLGRFRW